MTMKKDPFNSTPQSQIQANEILENIDIDDQADDEKLDADAAPRGLLRKVQNALVPIFAGAIAFWLFWPEEPSFKPSQRTSATPNVSTEIQGNNTNALINSLKADAEKRDLKASPASTAQAISERKFDPGTYKPSSGVIPANTAAASELDKIQSERAKREAEIRASPIEIGAVQLMADPNATTIASGSKLRLDELSEFRNSRKAAEAGATTAADRMSANLRPREDSQRKKTQDEEFVSGSESTAEVRYARLQAPISPYVIHQGTVIRAVLLTGVKSELPGSITAQVSSNVYDSIRQKTLLIPAGSRLNGIYNNQVMPGQGRLLVAMTRLILPDGSSISLAGSVAADNIGQSGLESNVDNHFFKMFGSSLIIGASSFFLGGRDNTTAVSGNGTTTSTTTVLGKALNDTVTALMDKNRNISPTLTNKPGEEFLFLVAKDLVMSPQR